MISISVLKKNREVSQYQFYINALALRKTLRFLLLRDLGIKTKVRDIEDFAQLIDKSDRDEFIRITIKNAIETLKMNYPEWAINKIRDKIWEHLDNLVDHIVAAYSIWPEKLNEYHYRRLEMDKAIISCEQLKKDLEAALEIIPIDAEKYLPYVRKIDREIALIKGWRKSDNKRFRKLGKPQKKQEE